MLFDMLSFNFVVVVASYILFFYASVNIGFLRDIFDFDYLSTYIHTNTHTETHASQIFADIMLTDTIK